MGEVYRATDTKLGREVAIKVLTPNLTQNRESIARFEREAKTLATLNHPNIAAIYGFDAAAETHFLVMELVEGETLDQRLKRGLVPVDEAMEIGRQIAEALEAAHEKGIIHRDLKPSNVKITPEGKVKVLDFGLAKAMGESPSSSSMHSTQEDSPTLIESLRADPTLPGVILGTAAYMSPEQARGKPVDKRSDIWSFGAVLYECLTGKRIFAGETATDSLGAVLHKEPDWSQLPPTTPSTIQLLLRKCLAKDRKRRLHDIADARVDLEQAISDPDSTSFGLAAAAVQDAARKIKKPVWALAIPWVLAALAAAFALFQRFPLARQTDGKGRLQTYTLGLNPEAPLSTASPLGSSIVISPDCSKVVYVGQKDGLVELYWKEINEPDFRLLPQSNKSWPAPVFSPDSERLAFFTMDGDLKVFAFQGGLPRKICDVGALVIGADWCEPDRLIYATPTGIYRVDVREASVPELILPKSEGEEFVHPRLLPGAKAMLVSVMSSNWVTSSLAVIDLGTKTRKPLELKGVYNAFFHLATRSLLYGRDDVMWARAFDPEKLEFSGPEVPLLKDVGRDWGARSHQFTMANSGTLLYARGHQTDPRYQLVWVKEHGSIELLPLAPGDYRFPRLAPGSELVVIGGPASQIMLVNLFQGLPTSIWKGADRLNSAAIAFDGTYAYFNQLKSNAVVVVRIKTDGTGWPQDIYKTPDENYWPAARSMDAKYLALLHGSRTGSSDIWIKDMTSEADPQPFVKTSANEVGPRFSPNGRWLAYAANTTDRYQVYVRGVSNGGLPIQVSKVTGAHPAWSPDGRRLYYIWGKQIMVAKIKTEEPLEFETPEVFATGRFASAGINAGANYDVFTGPDGDRLLMLKSIYEEPEPNLATHVTAVVNFDAYIRQQMVLRKP